MLKAKKKLIKATKEKTVLNGFSKAIRTHDRVGFICTNCLTGRYMDINVTGVYEYDKNREPIYVHMDPISGIEMICPKCRKGPLMKRVDPLIMPYILDFLRIGVEIPDCSDGYVDFVWKEDWTKDEFNPKKTELYTPFILFGRKTDPAQLSRIKEIATEFLSNKKKGKDLLEVVETEDGILIQVLEDISRKEINQILFPRLHDTTNTEEEYEEEIRKITEENPKMTLLNLQREFFDVIREILTSLGVLLKDRS